MPEHDREKVAPLRLQCSIFGDLESALVLSRPRADLCSRCAMSNFGDLESALVPFVSIALTTTSPNSDFAILHLYHNSKDAMRVDFTDRKVPTTSLFTRAPQLVIDIGMLFSSLCHSRRGKKGLMNIAYLPVFILLLLICFCKSEDQLTHAKPLSPGDMLISQDGVFALGFFSPTSSNRSLYLGIWYHSIPGCTVVWIANRDNPITAPSSAMLAITNSSDLVLSDSHGRTPWTTKNNITARGTEVAAVLLNSGNLVVRLPNGTNIWQSFDHPTDTILPTMRFLLSYKAHVVGRLVAWKGPDDPSSGDFSCSSDPTSNLQIVIWNGTKPYCRSAVFDSVSVYGGTFPTNTSSVMYSTRANRGDEFYFMYTVSDGSPYTRITLEYMGTLRSLSWNNASSSWVVISEAPATGSCDLYASCGPFGYCDYTGAVPTCHCLDGFEPDGLNFSRGCWRTEALKCGKENNFVTLPAMKVPDKFLRIRNRTFDQCAAECSSNCSCTAYAYANMSNVGVMADPSRCLVWTGGLVDTGKLMDRGENLYLRLADSPVQKKSNLVKIVLPITACLLLLTCKALVWICKYRGKRRKKEIQKRLMLGYLSASNGLEGKNVEFPFVSFEDILAATDIFF